MTATLGKVTLDLAITPGGRSGDASPLGTKGGPRRLDDYVRMVAHALMRKRGFSKSHAIATAKNALKRWRRGGGKVRPQVRAGAAAHLGIQEALDKRRGGGHNLAEQAFAHMLLDLAWEDADDLMLANYDVDLAWSDALHPRGVDGKFKSRGSKGKARSKLKLPGDKRPDQRTARKARLAQEELARRIIARNGMHRGQLGKVTGPHRVPSGEGKFRVPLSAAYGNFSEEQAEVLDFAVQEAVRRGMVPPFSGDVELAARWKHGWIPLNAEAMQIARVHGPVNPKQGSAKAHADFAKATLMKRNLDAAKRQKAIRAARANRATVEHSSRAVAGVQKHRAALLNDEAAFEEHYRGHVKRVDAKLMDPKITAKATSNTHATVNEHGEQVYNRARSEMHREVVRSVLDAAVAKGAKSDRKALFLGGLPGAGKTTAIGKIEGLNPDDYVTVNPDIFKEELAKRGLVPKIPGLSPMEATSLVHDESSRMALLLAEEARKRNLNIIWDITMNAAKSVNTRMDPLKDSGYHINAVFVDIPHSMSIERVKQRHRNGYRRQLADRTGRNLGQRLVPSGHVASARSAKGSSSANRDAFEEIKNRFDGFRIFDNSGAAPRELGRGGNLKF